MVVRSARISIPLSLCLTLAMTAVAKADCPAFETVTETILGTYFDFIDHKTLEARNDGLSTYILMPKESGRVEPFLSVFFEETMPVTAIPRSGTVGRDKFNVAYIPVSSARDAWAMHKDSLRLHANSRVKYADCMAGFVASNYDYERAHATLVRLCASSGRRPKFCEGDYTAGGPYLVTVSCRELQKSPNQKHGDIPCSSTLDWNKLHPGIALDLASFHEKSYRLLIGEYKAYVLKPKQLTDEWKMLESFRAKLVSFVLQASDIFEVSKTAQAQTIDVFGRTGAKDSEKKKNGR